jgi:hypothetical protein
MLLGSIFTALSGVDWKLIAGWSKRVNPNVKDKKATVINMKWRCMRKFGLFCSIKPFLTLRKLE